MARRAAVNGFLPNSERGELTKRARAVIAQRLLERINAT